MSSFAHGIDQLGWTHLHWKVSISYLVNDYGLIRYTNKFLTFFTGEHVE